MEGVKYSLVFTVSLVLICQLVKSTNGQFFTRFVTRAAHNPRLRVIDGVIQGRGRFEHMALPPQRNVSGPVKVLFSLGLIRIIDFDDRNLILSFAGLERFNWQDLSMTYTDTNKSPLVLPREGVWIPDFKVIGSLTPDLEFDKSACPLVYGTGEMMWLPKVKHVVGCSAPSSREFVCTLNFNSWHYSGNQVEPDFYGKANDWDMTYYQEHPLWQVSGHEARKNVKRVQGNTDVFVELSYVLRLRRK